MLGVFSVVQLFGRSIQRMFRDPASRGLMTLTAVVIATGTVFYHRWESLSWVDSFYFTIVTLTTVGYGDISPQTPTGKVFTAFYLFIGVGILVAFITRTAQHLADRQTERATSRRDKKS